MNNNVQKLQFSVSETAFMLNISQKSVRRLIERGLLKKNQALRHIRIPAEAVQEFLNTTTN